MIMQFLLAGQTGLAIAAVVLSFSVYAENVYPYRPEPPVYVLDNAQVLSVDEIGEIERVSRELQTGWGAPIFVLTLPTTERYASAETSLEGYVDELFRHWRIDDPIEFGGNAGVLIVYVSDGRRFLIRRGTFWDSESNAEFDRIAARDAVPQIEQDRIGEGLLFAVHSLGVLIRESVAPIIVPAEIDGAVPSIVPKLALSIVVSVVFTATIHLIRRRRRRGLGQESASNHELAKANVEPARKVGKPEIPDYTPGGPFYQHFSHLRGGISNERASKFDSND